MQPDPELGAALEHSSGELAARLTDRHFARRPEMAARFGPAGRAKCAEDARFHLRYFAQALALGVPDLFARYLAWAVPMLASRKVPKADLRPMPPRTLLAALSFGAFATLAQLFLRFLNRGTRSKVDTTRWTPELLKQLERRRFEELCAAYFEAHRPGAERASPVVQCEPWNAYRVGIKPVHALRDTMAAANVAEGVLVTSGKFTEEARAFARKQKTITLIDGADLLARIAALPPEQAQALLRSATQGDFLTPTCPTCALRMIPRKSTTHGRKFWGCPNYPRCKESFSGKPD